MMTSLAHEMAELLAVGYLRYRRRTTARAAEKAAAWASKPLDDVPPKGPLVPEPKGLCEGGKDHEE